MYMYVYIHITLNYTISLNFAATSPPSLNIPRDNTNCAKRREIMYLYIYLYVRVYTDYSASFLYFANQTTRVKSSDDNDGDGALQ